jgi:hypothetical protein
MADEIRELNDADLELVAGAGFRPVPGLQSVVGPAILSPSPTSPAPVTGLGSGEGGGGGGGFYNSGPYGDVDLHHAD